jgi:phosphatidylserine decarboxylase
VDTTGAKIKRAQYLGAFLDGGNTVIVLYMKEEVKLDDNLVNNSCELQIETLMKVGSRIGVKPSQFL